MSLCSGIFSDCLKLAKVTPIPKGGDSTNAGNYRPISLLPIFSNIFEKVVYKQSYTYFEQNNILYEHQYGFRKHVSTVQALLNHMQFMYDSIDSGNLVISVFLDFKTAFDIQLITKFYCRNLIFTELEEFHMNGINHNNNNIPRLSPYTKEG